MRYSILFSFFLVAFSFVWRTDLTAQTSTSTPENTTQATRFVVYYTGAVSDINTPNSYLKTLLDVHELQVVNTFEVTEEVKGFTLQIKEQSIAPRETANELSMVDGVMMVEIIYYEVNTES